MAETVKDNDPIEAGAADYSKLAQDAFIWGLTLVLFGRYLDIAVAAGVPFNAFFMNPDLSTPTSNSPGVNIDTLYGFAWIDLAVEPQIIGVPDTQDRYYSIQLQDAYMNTFNYIGRRATGTKAGAFALTPPGFTGPLPDGVTQIKAPTTKVFAFVRTLLRDQDDLAAARAANAAFTLGPLSAYPDGRTNAVLRADVTKLFPVIDLSVAGADYFDEMDRLVGIFPPLAWDAPNYARFAPLGLGVSPQAERTPELAAQLAAAVPVAYARVRQSLDLTWVNGWAKRRNVVPFILDPVQRAANSFFALATLVSEEGVYFSTRQGGMGEWLVGSNNYRIRFPAGQTPPVDAFWSLTLYDNKYRLFDNPIDRYGILDRTEGLVYQSDGSLEIQVQAAEPAAGVSNWIPAPRGEFQLMVRAYQPHAAILDETYHLPPIEIVGQDDLSVAAA